jgi:hypothetical protein
MSCGRMTFVWTISGNVDSMFILQFPRAMDFAGEFEEL